MYRTIAQAAKGAVTNNTNFVRKPWILSVWYVYALTATYHGFRTTSSPCTARLIVQAAKRTVTTNNTNFVHKTWIFSGRCTYALTGSYDDLRSNSSLLLHNWGEERDVHRPNQHIRHFAFHFK